MSRNGQGVGCRVDGSTPEINCIANNCYLFFLGYVIPVVYAKLKSRKGAVYNTLIHSCASYIYCILLFHIYYLCNLKMASSGRNM